MDERCSNKSGKGGDLNLCICARVDISTRDEGKQKAVSLTPLGQYFYNTSWAIDSLMILFLS